VLRLPFDGQLLSQQFPGPHRWDDLETLIADSTRGSCRPSAEIRQRQRTVMEYLLDAISRTVGQAARER
jgi:hypothetical protein